MESEGDEGSRDEDASDGRILSAGPLAARARFYIQN